MKKLIVSLGLAVACHSSSPPATVAPPVMAGNQTGAVDPIGAVRGFMMAAKQTDLQAVGALWGDQEGPARDRLPREELEKRELVMLRCLRHDSYDIAGDAPALGGSRVMVVKLSLGDVTRSTNVQVVRGPSNRWYVKDVDVNALNDICMHRT